MTFGGMAWVGLDLIAALTSLGWFWYKNFYLPYANPPMPIIHIKQMFKRVYPRSETIPIREGSESFTLNKNSITLCLRDPKTNQYYSWNTLAYVALHELSHAITKQKESDVHGP